MPTDGGDGGGEGAGSGAGSGSGDGFGSGEFSCSEPLCLPPLDSLSSFSFSSSSSVDSVDSVLGAGYARVCSLCRPERLGRLEGVGNSGQLPSCADSMKARQIGPAVGPPNPVASRDCGCPTQTAVEYIGV